MLKKIPVLAIVCVLAALTGCASNKTVKKTPKEMGALYVDLGTGALMRGELPQAVEDLRKAILLDPTNAIAHNHLGLAYYGLGKRELAKEEVQRAVSEDPKYSDAYINLGNFALQEKNNTLARHYYNKSLTNLEYKLRHRAHTALAQLALSENNTPDAKVNLAEALTANPDYCPAHFLLGTIFMRESNPARAAEHFGKSVLKVCTNNPAGNLQLGLAYTKIKEYTKAKHQFMYLVENFPQTVEAQVAGNKLKDLP